jgi:hypothetical protein
LLGAAAVASWFFALAARRHWATGRLHANSNNPGSNHRSTRFASNAVQLLLVIWTLVAAAFLLNAVRVGLLGYPDMMITGNGSNAQLLSWYQDRFTAQIDPTWVFSAPVLAYRLLMLLWALWLAASILRWVKWAWGCFSVHGYWQSSVKS